MLPFAHFVPDGKPRSIKRISSGSFVTLYVYVFPACQEPDSSASYSSLSMTIFSFAELVSVWGSIRKMFVVPVRSAVALAATAVLQVSVNGFTELLFFVPDSVHVPLHSVPVYSTPSMLMEFTVIDDVVLLVILTLMAAHWWLKDRLTGLEDPSVMSVCDSNWLPLFVSCWNPS